MGGHGEESEEDSMEEADNEIGDMEGGVDEDDDVLEVQMEARKTGPPKKRWSELGHKQKKRRSDDLFNVLKKTSEENGIEPVQMVGSLLHRY